MQNLLYLVTLTLSGVLLLLYTNTNVEGEFYARALVSLFLFYVVIDTVRYLRRISLGHMRRQGDRTMVHRILLAVTLLAGLIVYVSPRDELLYCVLAIHALTILVHCQYLEGWSRKVLAVLTSSVVVSSCWTIYPDSYWPVLFVCLILFVSFRLFSHLSEPNPNHHLRKGVDDVDMMFLVAASIIIAGYDYQYTVYQIVFNSIIFTYMVVTGSWMLYKALGKIPRRHEGFG